MEVPIFELMIRIIFTHIKCIQLFENRNEEYSLLAPPPSAPRDKAKFNSMENGI